VLKPRKIKEQKGSKLRGSRKKLKMTERDPRPPEPYRISRVRPYGKNLYLFTIYAALLLEAYQLCGAAFLPSVGWHTSSGSGAWLEWLQSVMALPYLVFESIPRPSIQDIFPTSLGGLDCGLQSHMWMASSMLVLGLGVIAPTVLVLVGMVLGLVAFWLIFVPRSFFACLGDAISGESDDDAPSCFSRVFALCFRECRCLFQSVFEDDDLSDLYVLECPTLCGGFGLVAGPAYVVVSLGLGPLALTVMSSIFSTFSCSYDYVPPLVTRSVSNTSSVGLVTGVECWSEVHLAFAITAAISFIPVYLGMLYFNIARKCQVHPKLEVVLHTQDTAMRKHVDVDPVLHQRQLLPGTKVAHDYRERTVHGYKGDGVYEVKDEDAVTKDVDFAHLKIVDSRFIEEKTGFVFQSVLDGKGDCCDPLSEEFKAKLRARGGVYITKLPRSETFEQVRFNPLNQLVSLQAKVFVAGLASFFGKADDWKRLCLLSGLFVTNVVLLCTAWRNPTTSNRRVNSFQLTCLSCCLVTTVVAMFANIAGTAAVVSWLLGVSLCAVVGLSITCSRRRSWSKLWVPRNVERAPLLMGDVLANQQRELT